MVSSIDSAAAKDILAEMMSEMMEQDCARMENSKNSEGAWKKSGKKASDLVDMSAYEDLEDEGNEEEYEEEGDYEATAKALVAEAMLDAMVEKEKARKARGNSQQGKQQSGAKGLDADAAKALFDETMREMGRTGTEASPNQDKKRSDSARDIIAELKTGMAQMSVKGDDSNETIDPETAQLLMHDLMKAKAKA